LNKVLKDDGSPKQSMLGKAWLTDSLLKAGGEDYKFQNLPKWFWRWLDDNGDLVPDKWAPKEDTESRRVKGVIVTPDRDGHCMIRCFFMGAFESFPDRIEYLVTLLTTTPCRLPIHDRPPVVPTALPKPLARATLVGGRVMARRWTGRCGVASHATWLRRDPLTSTSVYVKWLRTPTQNWT
jgi:hypothetical protein